MIKLDIDFSPKLIYVLKKQCETRIILLFNFPVRTIEYNVKYLVQTESISCLLMPYLLVSPGHQQPRYWAGAIDRI